MFHMTRGRVVPLWEWVAVEKLPLSVKATYTVLLVVLALGTLLLFAPSLLLPFWPWQPPPFNARFLGSIYFTEGAAVLIFLLQNRLECFRMSIAMGVPFAAIVTIGSLLQPEAFLSSKRYIVWLVIYGAYILIPIYLYWGLLRSSVAVARPLKWPAVNLETAAAVIVMLYGIALFVAPVAATTFWPWPVDQFHGRVYSGYMVAVGLGMLLKASGATLSESRFLGGGLVAMGVSALVGVVLASLATGKGDFSAAGTIVWCSLMVMATVYGLRVWIKSSSA
jgi:hypothetical protein